MTPSLRDSLAQVVALTPNTLSLIGDVLNGLELPTTLDYLIKEGHVVRMKDGRPVVTIPARDAYYASRRKRGEHGPALLAVVEGRQ